MILLDYRSGTWEDAKQKCIDANMTMITPETEHWTKRTWSAVGHWTPQAWSPPDAHADSFQTFWTGYREFDGEWVT